MSEERTDTSTVDLEDRSDEPSDYKGETAETGGVESTMPLFPTDESDRFRSRWTEIQTDFVDRPRESVEAADRLVADLMQRLTAQFGDERIRLEAQWDRGDDASTEELRVALTRYRSFFERLLTA
jgi:hypothetical protein